MYGIHAITVHNGWAIALVGALIVFSGLVFLASALSRLHKILAVWESKQVLFRQAKDALIYRKELQKIPSRQDLQAIKEVVQQYKILVTTLGRSFSLPKLIWLAQKRGLTSPHSTVNDLLTSKVIIPNGKGFFVWGDDACENLMEIKEKK